MEMVIKALMSGSEVQFGGQGKQERNARFDGSRSSGGNGRGNGELV